MIEVRGLELREISMRLGDRYRFLRLGPSAVPITNAASSAQRTGDGFNSSRISSAVVPLNSPLCPFFASWYATTARRTTGCSSGVKSMTVNLTYSPLSMLTATRVELTGRAEASMNGPASGYPRGQQATYRATQAPDHGGQGFLPFEVDLGRTSCDLGLVVPKPAL